MMQTKNDNRVMASVPEAYERAELKITVFDSEDVITTSGEMTPSLYEGNMFKPIVTR